VRLPPLSQASQRGEARIAADRRPRQEQQQRRDAWRGREGGSVARHDAATASGQDEATRGTLCGTDGLVVCVKSFC
jgi:hypothetical protein